MGQHLIWSYVGGNEFKIIGYNTNKLIDSKHFFFLNKNYLQYFM